jgi:hypothetical protein
MHPLDVAFVRSQSPAFSEPSLAGFAHFENVGGSFASRQTIEALHRYYRQTKVQRYYPFEPSATAGALMDSAKARLAAWLNAPRRPGAASLCQNSERRKPVESIHRLSSCMALLWERCASTERLFPSRCQHIPSGRKAREF